MMENASSASQPRNGRKPAYLAGAPAESMLLDATARDVDRQPAAVNPDSAALELHQVGKIHLDGDLAVCAVEDVSLRCPTGTWTVIVGPGQSGRSSLLRCAAGLDRVTSGRVLLGGIDVTESTADADRRGHVGLVSCAAEFAGSSTVEQYLRRPAPQHGSPSDGLVSALLAHVGMERRRDVAPTALAAQEQRCLTLLGALAQRPAVLIADEPTAGMGFDLAEASMSLLEQWVAVTGLTVLMASEELSGIRSADTACFLAAGRIVDSCSLGPRAVLKATEKSWSELCG